MATTSVNPRFKLKNPNSDKPTLILLKVYLNTQRFTYSTGEQIHPDNWDNNQKDLNHFLIIRK